MPDALLLVMTDGRNELLAQTIDSAKRSIFGRITRKVIHTDNGEEHRRWLEGIYPHFEVIGGGALRVRRGH